MSHTGIIWLGTIPLAAFTVWIVTEVRPTHRWVRIGSGSLAAACFAVWVLSFANSIGEYYHGIREQHIVHSLIRVYPKKQVEIEKWSSGYADFDGTNHERKMKELERILGDR